MARGVKSKYFGVFWSGMFLTALAYPEKADKIKDKAKIAHYKRYYNSFKYILPCKFCRDFIKEKLEKDFPLDFSGRIALMKSIYIWKDAVNRKLIAQGCLDTKPSPPFKEVLERYEALRAKCDKKIGKCV